MKPETIKLNKWTGHGESKIKCIFSNVYLDQEEEREKQGEKELEENERWQEIRKTTMKNEKQGRKRKYLKRK